MSVSTDDESHRHLLTLKEGTGHSACRKYTASIMDAMIVRFSVSIGGRLTDVRTINLYVYKVGTFGREFNGRTVFQMANLGGQKSFYEVFFSYGMKA